MKFLQLFAIAIAVIAVLISLPSTMGAADVGRVIGGFLIGLFIGALFLSPAHYTKNKWARIAIKATGLAVLSLATLGQVMYGDYVNPGGVAAFVVVACLAVFRKPKHYQAEQSAVTTNAAARD